MKYSVYVISMKSDFDSGQKNLKMNVHINVVSVLFPLLILNKACYIVWQSHQRLYVNIKWSNESIENQLQTVDCLSHLSNLEHLWFQIHKSEDLVLFSVLYNCKRKMGLLPWLNKTVKETLRAYNVHLLSISWHFIDWTIKILSNRKYH